MSALALAHGLHEGVPEAEYHRKELGLASKHALDLVLKAPAKYRASLTDADREPTPAMRFGSDFHQATLEPHLYSATTATARQREDAQAILGMRDAVYAHPVAGKLLAHGHPEVTARWRDSETGLECKARADLWVPSLGVIADLKSCADASVEEFSRSVAKYTYHVQAAMYLEGFRIASVEATEEVRRKWRGSARTERIASDGPQVDAFVFIAVEKEPPHLMAVYVLDEAAIERGRLRMRRGMRTLAECLAKDEWPGLPTHIQAIDLPRWYQD